MSSILEAPNEWQYNEYTCLSGPWSAGQPSIVVEGIQVIISAGGVTEMRSVRGTQVHVS